jgi:hypothetical protein
MKKNLIVAILVFLLMAGVCSADNTVGGILLDTVQQGEVNGGVYCDSYYFKGDQTTYDDQNIDKLFTVPDHSNVEWAMLMVDVYCGHMENNYAGWANVTFNGDVIGNESLDVSNTLKRNGGDGYVNINDHMNRVSSDYLMWYDVTDLIQEGNNNAFVHTEDKDNTKFDGRVIHITLVVAYDDGSDNTVYYCINQGHDVDSYYDPDDYIGSTVFSASIPSDKTVTNPTLTVVHRSSEDGTYTFNDASIESGTPQGEYAGTNTWDITDDFNQNDVNTLTYDRVGAFYKVQLGILTAEYQGETPPPSLLISADPTTVTVSTPTDVTFTVTDGSGPVEGAEITLTDCATGTGTTCAAGTAVISVDATSAGTITATASKEGYTSADITITAQEEEVNGYKGDKPLTTYRHDTTTGDLYFSHGDSFYSGKIYPDATYTVTHDVTLPDGATVEFARLYNYWTWSASGSTGKYPTMTLTINDNAIDPDAKYDDRKGWGSVYDYPAGTWAYDVTSQVTGSGTYTTVVTNTDTDSKSFVCMDGIGLLIVYNDPNGQQIEYWINEGADMLSTMDTSGGVTAQEATTISLFSGSVDLGSVESARLWTVVQSGGNEDNKLIFNTAEWTGVYDGTPYSDLDIDEARDVKDNLVASDNIAKIQAAPEATGGDYLMPSNAFLVLNIGGTPIPALSISANPANVFVSDPTDVTFTVTSDGTPVEGVGISLSGCADESGTTDANGVAVISVNATSAGTITAAASKDGYTSADTTLTAKDPGQASSSVSLSVDIKPAISFVVTPDNIDFGDLSPGETSAAQTLTLENNGGLGFTVTAQVSDNSTGDTLFKNGLLLDSAVWGDYTISIDAQTSDDADASLSVPVDYMELGQKHGKIVFWAQA